MSTILRTFLAFALVIPSVAAAGAPDHARTNHKIEICHLDGNGDFHELQVAAAAGAAHEGHGDVPTGAWYPDTDGDGLGEDSMDAVACPAEGLVDNVDDDCVASAEVEDGEDNDCDGWVDEDFTCPCFDSGDLDGLLAGQETAAFTWSARPWGVSEVTSLQGFEWVYDSDTAMWTRPTVGADMYRVDAEGGAPYCEVWSETYLAAPVHAWAGDQVSDTQAIAEESVSVCEGVLDAWIVDNGVPLTSW